MIFFKKKIKKNHYKKPVYSRDSNYRSIFLANKNGFLGFYICTYCGKIIHKKQMEVDHIISIDYANKNKYLRRKKIEINEIKNLTASCRSCNRRKSNKGGFWLFLIGKIGTKLQIFLWINFVIFMAFYIDFFFKLFNTIVV